MIDVYYSRVGSNSFIGFNENKEGFLVDPSCNSEGAITDHIKKLGVNIVAILITHGHFDHIHALEEVCKAFPNANVYIAEDEAIFLSNPEYNLSNEPEVLADGYHVLNYIPAHLVKVNDGDIIKEAGFEIKVIATPFHTIGSVCYYVESEKALFSGDTLFFTTIGRTDLPTGSNRTIESSLAKLKALPDGIKVYPGHGACTNLDRENKYNTYLKNL